MPSFFPAADRSARHTLVIVLLVGGSIAAGCTSAPSRRPTRVPVAVAQAERRTVPWEWEATGTVEPVASADVTAQVGGLVTRIAFREGDEVREGAVLMHLDSRSFEASAAQAAAVLARDRAQARSARLELERAETLARQQLLSSSELEDKRNAADALDASVMADSAALGMARLDLANATVRAPIGGRTGRLNVNVGDVVKADDAENPVVTIHQLRPIRVRFSIPQADLDALRRERSASVRVLVAEGVADTTWSLGRLAFVDNQVDEATGTVLLKGEFPNRDGALWPGEFVRVRLRLHDEPGATVVPTAAVGNSQQGPFCYVVNADTTVEMRPVQVSRTWREFSVITSGLKPGETVVTDGQMRLSPGARASIRVPAGREAAAPAGGSR